MRIVLSAAILPLALIGCSGGGGEDGGAANATGFVPPVNILRSDLSAGFARNFARLDRNGDGAIVAAEVPKRPKMVARLDADRDGRVTLDELRTGQLANFDRADANRDGTLTNAERKARPIGDAD